MFCCFSFNIIKFLGSVTTWSHLANYMSAKNIDRLKTIYSDVRDVDLFVGGINEMPAKGGLVGSTFGCIIERQFNDLKRGDRLYFENGPSATSFSISQLNEIRKVTMSKLICNNYKLSTIQSRAFRMPDNLANARVNCANIPELNLSVF